ncbi:hypothetical protein RJ640_024964 [Escallonia rubra]|uniref:Uncharacterized protein n=1 Tax=Escallonia rubra TaxID=112253 RepID=A0AA88SCV6_9ASTE|nr:hypothetical protein RJ640_024964 [Escallonia rubra]
MESRVIAEKGLSEFKSEIVVLTKIASYQNQQGTLGWALEKELHMLILNVVKERNEFGYENDLLQTLLEGAKNEASVFHDIYRKEHNNGNEWRQENSPVRTYLVLSSSLPQ